MDQTLIGRENEVRALTRAVQAGALVSVVGPPGVGKSRVARAVLRAVPSTTRTEHIDLDGARTAADIAARICLVRREPRPAPTVDEDAWAPH